MGPSLAKREAILADLADLQPPAQYDESTVAAFVGARQRLLDELQTLGESPAPLSEQERRYRDQAFSASENAMRLVREQQANVLAALAQQRRAKQQVREYGADSSDPEVPLVDRNG